jgi:DNA mismatch endonuclease (patch repair protein)
MVDNVSKKRRSQIMRLVKSKDTKLEIKFRKALKKLGYKFRKNVSNYFGKPDIILSKYKTVIFIDSCFWHGCAKHCRIPTSRRKYWLSKIERNKKRHHEVKRYYKKKGWNIFRFWEHDLNNITKLQKKIKEKLNKS